MKFNQIKKYIALILVTGMTLSLNACGNKDNETQVVTQQQETTVADIIPVSSLFSMTISRSDMIDILSEMPIESFADTEFILLNQNDPYFTQEEITQYGLKDNYEQYSTLDSSKRTQVAMASVCKGIMPDSTEVRPEISGADPSGWSYDGYYNNKLYDKMDGTYIYKYCQLIDWSLSGEVNNWMNLITGTTYMTDNLSNNVVTAVKDAVDKYDIHVLYRAEPIYYKDNAVASGVLVEAYSVEDAGMTIRTCAFYPNIQEEVHIDYQTGMNWE